MRKAIFRNDGCFWNNLKLEHYHLNTNKWATLASSPFMVGGNYFKVLVTIH